MELTTAIRKLHSLSKRKKVVQGGTWAGKTYGIIALLIDTAARCPGKRITIVAETIPAVKEGAVSQFKEIMQKTNRWVEGRYNINELTYSFGNGSKIQFKAFDSEGKAKAAGKRDILFINEANHIPFAIAYALIIRTEGDVWIDYNPDNEFWAHSEILPMQDAEFLLLKYTDNEGCPQTIIDELLQRQEQAKTSEYWKNWCRVYIDGEIGNIQGVVFEGWKQCDSIPEDGKFIAYGMDFGFTNDPTALVGVWTQNGELFVKELIYQRRLTNQQIAQILREMNINRQRTIIADCAEPKSIQEIFNEGFDIRPASKGADSIKNSIDILRRYTINVSKDSLNLIKELRSYKWQEDKQGEATNKPVDYNNHAIDALRYVALNKLSVNKSGEYHIS